MTRSVVVVLLVLSLLFCVAMGTPLSVAQLQPGTLCEKDEKIVSSCPVAKTAKIVSLCSSPELTKEKGYLQYRFGLPGKIELEFPKQREAAAKSFKYSHYFRAQVDLTAIKFTSDGYEYSVFDDYNGEERPVHHVQGITITPNTGKDITLKCR